MSLIGWITERSKDGQSPPMPRTYSFMPIAWHRRSVVKWLKRTHAWLGFWGALLAFFFSFTGIVLNHRTILPLGVAYGKTERQFLPMPVPPPANAEEMAEWLEQRFEVGRARRRVQVAPAKPAAWGEGQVVQPANWRIQFGSPERSFSANYWVGDARIEVVDYRPNFLMMLNALHRANGGVGVLWILITDAIAGALIVLSLTGILLWTRLHGRRLLAAGLGMAAPLVALASYLALL